VSRDKFSGTNYKWTTTQQRRQFFDDFAGANGFDPLEIKCWYRISHGDILKAKGAAILTAYYDGSFLRALTELYPELNFQRARFLRMKGDWADAKSRRQFFDNFAFENRFDPLIARNWYSIKYADLVKHKGSHSVLSYYSHSHTRALMALYPEIVFDRQSFNRASWRDDKSRKDFFLRLLYSLQQLRPEHTMKTLIYSLRREIILDNGGRGILEYYSGSYIQALMELFPEFDLEVEKFADYKKFVPQFQF